MAIWKEQGLGVKLKSGTKGVRDNSKEKICLISLNPSANHMAPVYFLVIFQRVKGRFIEREIESDSFEQKGKFYMLQLVLY